MIELQKKILGPYQTNSYLLCDAMTQNAILIDVPAEAETILSWIEPYQINSIVLTHGHADHVGALERVRGSLKAPVALHPADGREFNITAELPLEQGLKIALGETSFEVIHIPGHTQGSIALKVIEADTFLFAIVGDTIFPGGPGHTPSPPALRQCLDALEHTVFTWPDHIELHPGHGVSTSVGAEREAFEVFRARQLPLDLCGDVSWR